MDRYPTSGEVYGMEERIEGLAGEIRSSDRTVAFTGAGVSTPSGIPDFRSEGGIWENYETREFHIRAFERDPGAFWERMLDLYQHSFGGDPDPNPAHTALATLEQRDLLDRVITQNADGLHQDAGSGDVVELHGNLQQMVCRSCRDREPLENALELGADGDLPPECDRCGEPLKPDGVLFGEQLPKHELYESQALAQKSDVFVVAGSSLTVEPAASLPAVAADHGATLAIVNFDPTPLDDRATYTFREDVTTVLPALVDALVEDGTAGR